MKHTVEEKTLESARRPLFLILAIIVMIMPLLGNSYSVTFSSIFSSAFPALLQILFALLVLITIKKSGIPYKIPGYLIGVAGIWIVLGIWSTATGGHVVFSFYEQSDWVLLLLFAASTAYYFSLFPGDRQKIIPLIGYGFIGYFLFLMVFVNLVPDPDNYDWVSGLPGFSNVRHFGYYATIVLIVSYYGLLGQKMTWNSGPVRLTFLLLLLTWTAIIWAGGRGPFLAIGLTFLILAGFRLLPEWRRLMITTLLIIPLAVFFAEIIKVPDPSFGLANLLGNIDSLVQGDVNSYSSSRIDFWRLAIKAIREAPFFGYGPGMYPHITAEPYSLFLHPHNSVLQFSLAWGISGGVAAFLIIGFMLRTAIRNLRQASEKERPLILTGLAGMLTILCFSLVDGTFYHTLPLTFFVVLGTIALVTGIGKNSGGINLAARPFRLLGGLILIFSTGTLIVSMISAFLLYRPGIPGPDGLRADIVETFPVGLRYYAGGIIYGRWIDHWIEDREPGVEEKILRAMDKSPGTWVKTLMTARLAEVRGDFQVAADALKPLLADSHPVIQVDAKAIQSRICDWHGICPDSSTEFE